GFGSGGALIVTAAGGDLGAGYKGHGSLTIADGINVASPYGVLGDYAEATGSATITGTDSSWSIGDYIDVGRYGNGTIGVAAGGVVSAGSGFLGYGPEAVGMATITGSGSKWINSRDFFVGNKGRGMLNIEAGAEVSSSNIYLGYWGNSIGEVSVTGSGSKLTSSENLIVGRGGSGVLWVDGGGEVACKYAQIESVARESTVIGLGSKLTTSTDLRVGYGGSGSLYVAGGGRVSSRSGYIGSFSDQTVSEVTITGPGSQWDNDFLVVGYGPKNVGGGTLNITDGGLVTVAESLRLDPVTPGKDGFVNISTGGMLAVFGDVAGSLTQFLGVIEGSGTIRYWLDEVGWSPISGATQGVDYELQHFSTGDLHGYSLLTVGTISAGPPGDFNGDTIVDGADLLRWQRGGSPDPNSATDLAVWQTNYGAATPLPTTADIPEPTAWILIGLSLVGFRRFCNQM
ncbi:MAG: hypothetical protein KDA44_23150, partial [Planctomycetales bacterium]|nr:hypothetical protein [Planctomycetales bacterium]